MTTSADTRTPHPNASWPFPAAGHFRKAAAPPPAPGSEDDDHEDQVDHAEQELVEEQKERDRKAAHAVDPNKKDRPAP